MLEKPARNTGAHVVYAELKRQILTLELKPGERIYEPAMAAALQVSRTPLREAIRRLISENLLEQQPTGGVLVPILGVAPGTVDNIHRRKLVRVKTARVVAEVYDRLWDKPAPEGRNRSCALAMARRKGFVPPLAWDDDEIDDPAARPHGEWRAVA